MPSRMHPTRRTHTTGRPPRRPIAGSPPAPGSGTVTEPRPCEDRRLQGTPSRTQPDLTPLRPSPGRTLGSVGNWFGYTRDVNSDGVPDPAEVLQENLYDGLNRRIARIEARDPNFDRTDYYYNASWQIVETRKAEGVTSLSSAQEPPATDVYCQYVWDQRYIDSPILRDENTDPASDNDCTDTGGFERLYYLNDANFNVTALVDTSGSVVERYTYDAYGQPTVYNASWTAITEAASKDNAIRFCGYVYDAGVGLYHVRHRTYHPTLGRWLQRDPAGYVDGMSVYEYCGGNAIALHDPLGKWVTYSKWASIYDRIEDDDEAKRAWKYREYQLQDDIKRLERGLKYADGSWGNDAKDIRTKIEKRKKVLAQYQEYADRYFYLRTRGPGSAFWKKEQDNLQPRDLPAPDIKSENKGIFFNFVGPGHKGTYRTRPVNLVDFAAKLHDMCYHVNNVSHTHRNHYGCKARSRITKCDLIFLWMIAEEKKYGVKQELIRKLTMGGFHTKLFGLTEYEFDFKPELMKDTDGFVNVLKDVNLDDPSKYLMIPYNALPEKERPVVTVDIRGDQFGRTLRLVIPKYEESVARDTDPGWRKWAEGVFRYWGTMLDL